jgi:hypothetical protein
MSFRAYAVSQNLNIPTVVQPGETRLIDPAAADHACGRNSNIRTGHGGKADRGVRAPLQFAACQSGFEPGQRAWLAVLIEDVPGLMQRAMLSLGCDETTAKGVFALEEIVQYAAAALLNERNAAGCGDYRRALPPVPELHWSPAAAALIADLRMADPTWVDTIDDEALTDDMLEAGNRAKP